MKPPSSSTAAASRAPMPAMIVAEDETDAAPFADEERRRGVPDEREEASHHGGAEVVNEEGIRNLRITTTTPTVTTKKSPNNIATTDEATDVAQMRTTPMATSTPPHSPPTNRHGSPLFLNGNEAAAPPGPSPPPPSAPALCRVSSSPGLIDASPKPKYVDPQPQPSHQPPPPQTIMFPPRPAATTATSTTTASTAAMASRAQQQELLTPVIRNTHPDYIVVSPDTGSGLLHAVGQVGGDGGGAGGAGAEGAVGSNVDPRESLMMPRPHSSGGGHGGAQGEDGDEGNHDGGDVGYPIAHRLRQRRSPRRPKGLSLPRDSSGSGDSTTSGGGTDSFDEDDEDALLDESHHRNHLDVILGPPTLRPKIGAAPSSSAHPGETGGGQEEDTAEDLPQPIPLESHNNHRRKFYSFSGRTSYRRALASAAAAHHYHQQQQQQQVLQPGAALQQAAPFRSPQAPRRSRVDIHARSADRGGRGPGPAALPDGAGHESAPSILVAPPPDLSRVKPYQPSRNNSLDEVGLGNLGREELSAIFKQSPQLRGRAATAPAENGHHPFHLSQGHSIDLAGAHHDAEHHGGAEVMGNGGSASSLLRRPIPLEERTWSIPSIHLAHHVRGTNTDGGSLASYQSTSYTCSESCDDSYLLHDYDDDEEYIGGEEDEAVGGERRPIAAIAGGTYEDDASLSTRGSSFVPTPMRTTFPQEPQTTTPAIVVDVAEGLDKVSIHANRGLPADESSGAGEGTSSSGGVVEASSTAAVALSLAPGDEDFAPTAVDEPKETAATSSQKKKKRTAPRPHPHHPHGHHHRSRSRGRTAAQDRAGGGRGGGRREEAAIAWLSEVRVGRENEFLAEAASSKFLTGRVTTSVSPPSSTGVPHLPTPPPSTQEATVGAAAAGAVPPPSFPSPLGRHGRAVSVGAVSMMTTTMMPPSPSTPPPPAAMEDRRIAPGPQAVAP